MHVSMYLTARECNLAFLLQAYSLTICQAHIYKPIVLTCGIHVPFTSSSLNSLGKGPAYDKKAAASSVSPGSAAKNDS